KGQDKHGSLAREVQRSAARLALSRAREQADRHSRSPCWQGAASTPRIRLGGPRGADYNPPPYQPAATHPPFCRSKIARQMAGHGCGCSPRRGYTRVARRPTVERLLITGVDGVLGGNLALKLADRTDILGLYGRQAVSCPLVRTAP